VGGGKRVRRGNGVGMKMGRDRTPNPTGAEL